MREALKRLSNFVDANVLLEEELTRLYRTLSDVYVEGAEATLDTHNTRCQDASTYSGALENTRGGLKRWWAGLGRRGESGFSRSR